MDALLQTLGIQTVNCAIRYGLRSGIVLTSKYAIQQYSRLVNSVNDKAIYTELKTLQNHLDCKIKVRSIIYSWAEAKLTVVL